MQCVCVCVCVCMCACVSDITHAGVSCPVSSTTVVAITNLQSQGMISRLLFFSRPVAHLQPAVIQKTYAAIIIYCLLH